jgi:hypothetical protein
VVKLPRAKTRGIEPEQRSVQRRESKVARLNARRPRAMPADASCLGAILALLSQVQRCHLAAAVLSFGISGGTLGRSREGRGSADRALLESRTRAEVLLRSATVSRRARVSQSFHLSSA